MFKAQNFHSFQPVYAKNLLLTMVTNSKRELQNQNNPSRKSTHQASSLNSDNMHWKSSKQTSITPNQNFQTVTVANGSQMFCFQHHICWKDSVQKNLAMVLSLRSSYIFFHIKPSESLHFESLCIGHNLSGFWLSLSC